MRLTGATLWSVTFGFTGLIWILLPPLRPLLSGILAAHAPVLVWGVFDIRSRFFGPVLLRSTPSCGALALTFDDGPDPAVTPEVVRMLAEFDSTATFFVIGERAQRHPALIREIATAGHTVGCHTMRHSPWSNFRAGAGMKREIAASQESVRAVLGRTPLLYRPAVGLMNPHVHPALSALGMVCVGWSRRAGDAANRNQRAIGRIPYLAGPGEIVLLHDTAPDRQRRELFLNALRELLAQARHQGLRCVTVDEMFGIPAYR